MTPLFLAVLAATPGSACQAVLVEALNMLDAGRPFRAADELVRCAESRPTDPFADDVLDQAARIRLRVTFQPVEAAALYRRIVEEYPTSRHARRARLALVRLEPDLAHPDALASLLAIQVSGHIGPRRSDALRRHLRRHPEFPGVHRVRLLLADALVETASGHDEAAELYRLVAEQGPPRWGRLARRGLGDALLLSWDLEGARREYGRLASPALLAQVDLMERFVALERLALLFLALASAALLLVIRPWDSPAAAFLPPPAEVRYLAPVLAVAAAAGALQPGGLLLVQVLGIIGGGTLAWTWLAAAFVRRRAPTGPFRWALPVLSAAVVVCLCFVAVRSGRLGYEVAETFLYGPER